MYRRKGIFILRGHVETYLDTNKICCSACQCDDMEFLDTVKGACRCFITGSRALQFYFLFRNEIGTQYRFFFSKCKRKMNKSPKKTLLYLKKTSKKNKTAGKQMCSLFCAFSLYRMQCLRLHISTIILHCLLFAQFNTHPQQTQ